LRHSSGIAGACALALVLLTAGSPAHAQSTGGLTVLVLDEQGVLPGATVTISNTERRVKTYSELTGKAGRVGFPVLPPGGGYVIEVSFPGYGTVRQTDLRVRANKTPVLTVKLVEEYTERVRIVERGDVVDLEQTTTSTKFNDEFIQDLPVAGRFYQNVLTLAPGVQDANNDGNPNVHGSRARDFRAIVGGVANVDPLTGKFRANVNPNSIEEIEVITAGAGPEFGRAQGGFANIIQKQGSNELEGVFDFIYRSSELDKDGAARLSNRRTPEFDWVQPSVQLSGPIVKDKLWFRLSHEWIDREDPLNVAGGLEVVTNEQQINSDQLTWQVSDRNKLAFKYDANPLEISNFGVSSLTPGSAAQIREFEADTWSTVWSASYSPQVFVESTAAWQDGGFEIHPTTRGVPNTCVTGPGFIENAACSNLDNGTTSGSYWLDFEDWRQRFTVRSDATVYAKKRLLGMTHQFKFGFIVENERYVREIEERPRIDFNSLRSPFTNEVAAFDPVGFVLIDMSVPPAQKAEATGATWGIYFKDQMKPRDNLTIEIGARFEREIIDAEGREELDPAAEFALYNAELARGEIIQRARATTFTAFEGTQELRDQLAAVFGLPPTLVTRYFGPLVTQAAFQTKRRGRQDLHFVNENFSPFLAISWDPWSNGRTKLAATAGRHYNNIPLIVATQELAPATTSVQFFALRIGGRWTVPDIRQTAGAINPSASLQVVDRDLKTPYQDELTVTFERELWAESSLSLTWVRRRYRDQLQDIDINHVPGDYGRCVLAVKPGDSPIAFTGPDGVLDDCTGLAVPGEPISIPGGGVRVPFLQRPDGRPDLYRLNPFFGEIYQIGNYNEADYDAVVLQILRRQYRGWELQGSYTWSEATGNGEDFDQFLGDDQSTREDEEGFQSTDQRHVVKIAATTITPWGIRLGGTVVWQSGLPYSLLSQGRAFDALPPTLGSFGSLEPRPRTVYPSGARNDQRNTSYWDFNVKATREFNARGGVNLQLSAEIFNLLNEGTYQVYNPFLETGFQLNGNNDAYRRFGRRFQLGLRVSF
jgi:hypothetical protein